MFGKIITKPWFIGDGFSNLGDCMFLYISKHNLKKKYLTLLSCYRHSLLATELLLQLRAKFSMDIAVKDLFTYPTIHSISRFIEAQINKTNDVVMVMEPEVNLQEEVNKYDQSKVK